MLSNSWLFDSIQKQRISLGKMPGIDGAETLRQIRANGFDAPIYIVTAFMSEFLQELATAAKQGLVFGLGQKPLSGKQIRLLARNNIEGPQTDTGE